MSEVAKRAAQMAEQRLAKATRTPALRVVTADEFVQMEIPPREMLLAPWLPEQGLAMLFSKRGVGKTHVALGIAHAVATGGDS